MPEAFPIAMQIATQDAGKRLDQYLAAQLKEVSRARVQEMIAEGKVLVNDAVAKPSLKLRGTERITVLGQSHRPPLKAIAEEIPLDIVYEDDDLAVINKPAGMTVHAGAGATEDARNRGTLVNALLHHLKNLSGLGGELRPGIVHRLDKETSGLIVVAKNDEAHRKLGAQFAAREVKKKYVTLVHGWVKKDSGTLTQSISRDPVRRMRMTTRLEGGRTAVTHYRVVRRLDTHFGKVYPARYQDRYWTHPPDPCSSLRDGTSGGGRYGVWRPQTGAGQIGCHQSGEKFPAFRRAGISPSPHRRIGSIAMRSAGRISPVSQKGGGSLSLLAGFVAAIMVDQMSRIFRPHIFSRGLLLNWSMGLFLSAGTSVAQTPSPATPPPQQGSVAPANPSPDSGTEGADIPKIRVGTNEVNVVFTVTDKHGKRVTDLKQTDFRVVDDNRPATDIRSFHSETNLPLEVGLLVDASSSVRDRFKFEQESAIEFLNQTVRRHFDEAFVVGFDATPEVTQDFTGRYGKAGAWRSRIASRRGHGALRRALLCLPRQAAESQAERAQSPGHYSSQ